MDEAQGKSTPQTGVADTVRVQTLATEHWSLLATRGMTWNEVFSRASMFFTVLSASVVALALVAQASDFGDNFRLLALLLLPVVFLLGLFTVIRLRQANTFDASLVNGMNRLRRGYLDITPDLEPYFIMGVHDEAGMMQTYGIVDFRVSHIFASSPFLVGPVNALVAAVLAVLIAEVLGAPVGVYVAIGVVAGIAYLAALLVRTGKQEIDRFRRKLAPRFPG